jgi:hypothetical protein
MISNSEDVSVSPEIVAIGNVKAGEVLSSRKRESTDCFTSHTTGGDLVAISERRNTPV